MSWAEFVLRSIGHSKKQEREEVLFREVAYQGYCMQYLFAKGTPQKKDTWWKIGSQRKSKINEEQKQAFLEAVDAYKKIKNGS